MTTPRPEWLSGADEPEAQLTAESYGVSAEHQGRLVNRIRSLGVANGVLHLGGHPDDEEGGMIAFMSRRHAARTVYWSATRGGGGQNRSGGERADALGLVRTWESLEARAIDGGEVMYGPFFDFGFSKSGEDTLRRWGRDDVVREIVRAIRLVQPLVVVSRWSGGPSDGHGHHQAVGLAAREAYDAAGDPARFPELGLPAWQPQKLYRSVAGDWQPGEFATFGAIVDEYEQAGYLRIDTGRVDPLSGLTYQELAHLAINRHRTQGMGFAPEPGSYYFYYRLEHSQHPVVGRETSMWDGLDPTLVGLADYPGAAHVPGLKTRLEEIQGHVEDAVAVFRAELPTGAVPHLLEALVALRELAEQLPRGEALGAYVRRRAIEVEATVAACHFLRVECLGDRARVTPAGSVEATVRLWNGSDDPVDVRDVRILAPSGWVTTPGASMFDGAPGTGPTAVAHFRLDVPESEPLTTPYWLRTERNPYRYTWPQAHPSLGRALDAPLVLGQVEVVVRGEPIRMLAPLVRRDGVVGGARELPLAVLPPFALEPRQRHEILAVGAADQTLELDATVRCIEATGSPATLSLRVPPGWRVEPEELHVAFESAGETRTARLHVTVPAGAEPGTYELLYDLRSAGLSCGVELNPVRRGIPGSSDAVDENNCVSEAFIVRPAKIDVDLVDVAFVTTLSYAYIHGAEEEVLPAVSRFGLNFTELTDSQLEFADLSSFAAVVVGPKAYNVRAAVRQNAARLLDYVSDGGTLIVQYQAYGYDEPSLLPWPATFNQPHDRVTDASAPVEILDPSDPLMTFPNRIEARDFDGWVYDRGLYFLGEWNWRYTPVLACSDPGEPPLQGGLLTAAVGHGTFVYLAYSLFRQIPAGVPGAIRLFANLLGLAEIRVRERAARLAGVELFGYMSEAQLYEAARIVSERRVDAGTYLAKQGERGRELIILVEGEIAVLKEAHGRPDRLLHTARPGEALGELTLLTDLPRTASLRAVTDAVVLIVRGEAFQDWLNRHPELARRLLAQLAEKIVAKDDAG